MGQLNSIVLTALGVCVALWAIRNLWRGERGDGVAGDPLVNAALLGVGCNLALWFIPDWIEDFPEEVFTGVSVSSGFWLALFLLAAGRHKSRRARKDGS